MIPKLMPLSQGGPFKTCQLLVEHLLVELWSATQVKL